MTCNRAAVDHRRSYSVNRGRFRYDLPEPERDQPEQDGTPVPEWVDGYAVTREKEEAR